MKRITSILFLAVEAVLLCTFVAMDITHHGAENIVKYTPKIKILQEVLLFQKCSSLFKMEKLYRQRQL